MKRLLVLVTCLLLGAAPALADDLFAPAWRGDDNTVLAEWDTWDGFSTTDPFYPDDWHSIPAGLPSPDAMAYDTAEYLSVHEGRDDVVKIDGFLQLDFLMPNFVGQELTETWIQLTYLATEPAEVDFLIDTDPYSDDINGPQLMDAFDHGDGWVTEAYLYTILPSPESALFALDFSSASGAAPVYLDQVVFDSVAVPEPVSALILALGGVAVLRRRR